MAGVVAVLVAIPTARSSGELRAGAMWGQAVKAFDPLTLRTLCKA
jgi:hypothetical protein